MRDWIGQRDMCLGVPKATQPRGSLILQLCLQLAFAHSALAYNLRLCIMHCMRDALDVLNVSPFRVHYIRVAPCLCPIPFILLRFHSYFCDSIHTSAIPFMLL